MTEIADRNVAYDNWLESREWLRGELYSKPDAPQEECDRSLGGLALGMDFRSGKGRNGDSDLYQRVASVMELHNEAALHGGESLYALRDPADVPRIAKLASRVVSYWQRTCDRYDQPSPFEELSDAVDLDNPAVQRVIELGSVILEMMQYGMTLSKAGVDERHYLPAFIARRSPEYARRWMKKDIIREYCDAEGIEYANALSYITPRQLKRTVITASQDPEKKAARAITWFNDLTPQKIADQTGWTEEEVTSAFSPERLMRLCWGKTPPLDKIKSTMVGIDTEFTPQLIAERLGWDLERVESLFTRKYVLTIALERADPQKKIDHIAYLLDNELSIRNIAATLDMPPQDIDDMFSPGFLRDVAFGFSHPMKKIEQIARDFNTVFSIENIASELAISEGYAGVIFSKKMRINFATKYKITEENDGYKRPREMLQTIRVLGANYGITGRAAVKLARYCSPDTARKKAAIVIRELPNKPLDVSDELWMSVVATAPHDTHQQHLDRLRLVCDLFEAKKFDSVAPVDPQEEWRFSQASMQYSLLPGSIDSEPSQRLVALGRKAGVSKDDLEQLLLLFGDSMSCEIDDDQAAELIARIQAAAGE